MTRPKKSDYPCGWNDDPLVEFKRYTDALELYCDGLEQELDIINNNVYDKTLCDNLKQQILEREERIKCYAHMINEANVKVDYMIKLIMGAGICSKELLDRKIECLSHTCEYCINNSINEILKENK